MSFPTNENLITQLGISSFAPEKPSFSNMRLSPAFAGAVKI